MPRNMPRQRSTRSSPAKRGPRSPYQLTCANCRMRKVKCDGAQPHCRICTAYGEPCHYDKAPPMSQILAMSSKITELERALAELRQTQPTQEQPPHPEPIPPSPSTPFTDPSLSVSTLYTSTSALPSSSSTNHSSFPLPSPSSPSPSSILLHLPPQTITHLLTTNFTWFQPIFKFVSAPLFLRDAAAGIGPNFSPLLLATLCLHSTRLTSHSLTGQLLAQVRMLLAVEIHNEPSLPTIQALLLLSAREAGRGERARAWLYSGMAFRMAVDVGVFGAERARKDAGEEEDEGAGTRGRLAWSCYLWDKAVSLYLGRTPVLLEAPAGEVGVGGEEGEIESWRPYYGDGEGEVVEMESYSESCFGNFCRLGLIITDVLMTVYAKKVPMEMLPFVQQTRRRLEDWRASSPVHLRVEPGDGRVYPPHILSQNLLYYATIILLHRPFRGSLDCRAVCRDASQSIAQLLILVENTFGLTHVSYLMAYCVYTAATVTVLDLHDDIEGSQQRIETYLRALRSVRTACPGIQCSIDLIKRGIESRVPPTSQDFIHQEDGFSSLDPGPLPAFPLDQYGDYTQFNVMPLDNIPFGGLDPYALDWSSLSNDFFGDLLSNA